MKFRISSDHNRLKSLAVLLTTLCAIYPADTLAGRGVGDDDDIDGDPRILDTDFVVNPHGSRGNILSGNNEIRKKDDTGCPVEFDGRCTCSFKMITNIYPTNFDRKKKHYVVDCSDARFTNASMLQYLPSQTEKLVFTGNDIKVLPQNVLGLKEYPKLMWIDMSRNNIEEIKGKAFHHVSSVEVLILSYNQISNKSIHDHSRVFSNFVNLKALFLNDAFNNEIWSLADLAGIFAESNLTKLEKLHMEDNEIELIQDQNLFCDLTSLREIYLANNFLSDLNVNLTCLPQLSYINLSRNQIRHITTQSYIYGLLNSVNTEGDELRLDLSDNPFICDCNLQLYIEWVKNATRRNPDRVYHRDRLNCYDGSPASNRDLHLTQVNQTTCEVLQISNLHAMTTTLVWILSFMVIALVVALLFVQRKAVARTVQPLLQPTAQGVKYTSIEKAQEEGGEIAHV